MSNVCESPLKLSRKVTFKHITAQGESSSTKEAIKLSGFFCRSVKVLAHSKLQILLEVNFDRTRKSMVVFSWLKVRLG